MELLAVGDEAGHLYIYAVEYPDFEQRDLYNWHGALNILVRLEAHTQQVCGIAWSIDNAYLATGGNDNSVFIFETKRILPHPKQPPPRPNPYVSTTHHPRIPPRLPSTRPILKHPLCSHPPTYPTLPASSAKHHIPLTAAIKALSFAPWSPSLVALGAGSNDRGIHFHHAGSGAKLAAIDTAAQVTSLV